MNETAANPEKLAKAKDVALSFIDQAWFNTLTDPMVIFMLVFALAILFLARTGLWRGGQAKQEAAKPPAATDPATFVPVQPALAMPQMARPAMLVPAAGAVPLEAIIAHQHAETTARTDRALALSEEALRLHAAALDELTKMNDALNRLVAQVEGAAAAQETA